MEKCTIGKDGRKYYFRNGKRISRANVKGKPECKRGVQIKKKKRKAPVRKAPARKVSPEYLEMEDIPSPERKPSPSKDVYFWELCTYTYLPGKPIMPCKFLMKRRYSEVNRTMIERYYRSSGIPDLYLALVTSKTVHKELLEFIDNLASMSEKRAEKFVKEIYPNLRKYVYVLRK